MDGEPGEPDEPVDGEPAGGELGEPGEPADGDGESADGEPGDPGEPGEPADGEPADGEPGAEGDGRLGAEGEGKLGGDGKLGGEEGEEPAVAQPPAPKTDKAKAKIRPFRKNLRLLKESSITFLKSAALKRVAGLSSVRSFELDILIFLSAHGAAASRGGRLPCYPNSGGPHLDSAA